MGRIDPRKFAASVVALLSEDPRRYRNFGAYWYFVKALLRKLGYTRDNLYLLGDYRDGEIEAAMPKHASLAEALAAAIEEYRGNAAHNLGRSTVLAPDGEVLALFDEDAGL